MRGRIVGPDGLAVEVLEAAGEIAAGKTGELTAAVTFDKPVLWSLEQPALYRLESELRAEGDLVDTAATPFGIRKMEFSAEKGFLLNGQAVKLKGGCVHHDNGVLGSASYARSEERKVEVHKASGYNAIRTRAQPARAELPRRLRPPGHAGDGRGLRLLARRQKHRRLPCRLRRLVGSAISTPWCSATATTPASSPGASATRSWSATAPEGKEIARFLAERVRQNDPTRPVTSAICGTWSAKQLVGHRRDFL